MYFSFNLASSIEEPFTLADYCKEVADINLFATLLFVKTSEKRRVFQKITLTKGYCLLYLRARNNKVAIEQPCRKSRTVILHCNLKNAVTMSTFFNKGQRMPNIFERARAYEDGNEGYVQQQRPKTNIVINTNRLWYGEDSTVSAFFATA